jgi:phosphate:Na+ symporter
MFYGTLTLIGSLGLFLYGMKVMSEGLQRSAGEGLRSILQSMTRNRFAGLFTGFVTTSVVQSSSATTVMLVGFVNAGLVNLRQAIGVIMGANIGTTVTFWLVSYLGFKFDVTSLALPAIGVGMVLLLVRKFRLTDVGATIVGFGLLFLGLGFLKDSVPDLRQHPEIFEFVQQWEGASLPKILAFFALGTLLTVLVQSSSAAGAITLALAYKGWIDFPSACAVVLGENVGTTITANIAAIGANVNARRAARAHFFFNVIGVLWMLAVFGPFVKLMYSIMPGSPDDPANLPQHLALFHSLFNIANTALLIGFVPWFEKGVVWLVRDRRPGEGGDVSILASSVLPQMGELNLVAAEGEVRRLAEIARKMFRGYQGLYRDPKGDFEKRVLELKELEESSDRLAESVTRHLILCSSDRLSEESAKEVTAMLQVVAELEAICDCCFRLVKMTDKRYRKNRALPEEEEKQLDDFSTWVLQFIEFCAGIFGSKITTRDMTRGVELENHIDRSRKQLRQAAMRRMQTSQNIQAEMLYVDMVNTMERIGNHCLNTLQALSRPARFEDRYAPDEIVA